MRTQKKTVRNGRSKTAEVVKLAVRRKQLTATRRSMAKRVPAAKAVELPVGTTSGDRNILGPSERVGVDSVKRSAPALGTGSPEKIAKIVDKWTPNVEQFSRMGAAVSHGLQEISREWVGWTRARAQNSQQGFIALMQCRSPHEFFEVQSRILNQNLELLTASTRRMIEISSEMTSRVSPRITPAV